jgi:hypothetical protein
MLRLPRAVSLTFAHSQTSHALLFRTNPVSRGKLSTEVAPPGISFRAQTFPDVAAEITFSRRCRDPAGRAHARVAGPVPTAVRFLAARGHALSQESFLCRRNLGELFRATGWKSLPRGRVTPSPAGRLWGSSDVYSHGSSACVAAVILRPPPPNRSVLSRRASRPAASAPSCASTRPLSSACSSPPRGRAIRARRSGSRTTASYSSTRARSASDSTTACSS